MNPNHDEKGLFASGSGGNASGEVKAPHDTGKGGAQMSTPEHLSHSGSQHFPPGHNVRTAGSLNHGPGGHEDQAAMRAARAAAQKAQQNDPKAAAERAARAAMFKA